MARFRSPDFQERRNSAATFKKGMLENFRDTRLGPGSEKNRLKRVAVNEARVSRAAAREAAKKVRAVELAAQAALAADLAARTQREVEEAQALAKAEAAEREAALATQQKAARDARYAARMLWIWWRSRQTACGCGSQATRVHHISFLPFSFCRTSRTPMILHLRTNPGAVAASCRTRTSSGSPSSPLVEGMKPQS
jgi:hypothetical protein